MSAGLYSTISQSYAQILPDARSYNTITNPVFIRNDGNPVSISNGKMSVNGALLVGGGMEVDGSIGITGTLQHAYNNPNSFAEVYTSYVSSGTTNASERANYILYNGNQTGGGIEASTLQMFAYTPSGGINYNWQIRPDGSVYVPNAVANVQSIQALTVSTINGAQPLPSPGAGQEFSMISTSLITNSDTNLYVVPNAPTVAGLCEGFVSFSVTWLNPPATTDSMTISFSGSTTGGGIATSLSVSVPIEPMVVAGKTTYYGTISGFFQTDGTGVVVKVVPSLAVPTNYSILLINGNLRVIS